MEHLAFLLVLLVSGCTSAAQTARPIVLDGGTLVDLSNYFILAGAVMDRSALLTGTPQYPTSPR